MMPGATCAVWSVELCAPWRAGPDCGNHYNYNPPPPPHFTGPHQRIFSRPAANTPGFPLMFVARLLLLCKLEFEYLAKVQNILGVRAFAKVTIYQLFLPR